MADDTRHVWTITRRAWRRLRQRTDSGGRSMGPRLPTCRVIESSDNRPFAGRKPIHKPNRIKPYTCFWIGAKPEGMG